MTKFITEKPQNDSIPSLRSANAFRLKQKTEELTKATPSIFWKSHIENDTARLGKDLSRQDD